MGFITPILKGFLTEMGVEAANLGIQVYGGHGYIKSNKVRGTRASVGWGLRAFGIAGESGEWRERGFAKHAAPPPPRFYPCSLSLSPPACGEMAC